MKLLSIGLLSVLMSALLWTSSAGAESTATCVHRWTDSLSPGLTTTPGKAAFTSHGETGTIDCYGEVRGQRVTGTGTFGEEGVFEGTCAFGSSSAVFSFTIPTAGGPAKFEMPVTFTYAGFGSTSSDVFPGAFAIIPTAGDCLTTPITKVAVTRVGSLKSSPPAVTQPPPITTAGGRCAVTQRGSARGETLRGTAGDDRLLGLGGNDLLKGLAGADCLYGGTGSDRLEGGTGNDDLNGGSGNDVLRGDKGTDGFRGNAGNDRIIATDGRRERIDCGKGRDTATVDRRDRVRGCERVRRR